MLGYNDRREPISGACAVEFRKQLARMQAGIPYSAPQSGKDKDKPKINIKFREG